MDKTLRVVEIVLPVLAALILGMIARNRKVLTAEGVTGVKTLVIRFTLPAVIFGAFYKAAYDLTVLVCFLVIFGACCAGYLAGRMLQKLIAGDRALLPFLTTGFEMGMMGYALYIMLFGQENISNMAVADLGQVLFVFTVYQTLLNMKKGQGAREAAKAMLTTPVFLAIAAGVFIGATGLGKLLTASSAGRILDSLIDFIGRPTACAILFAVGYEIRLSKSGVKDAFIAAAARLLIMAALCALTLFVLGLFIQIGNGLRWAIILMFTLPAPFVLPAFLGSGRDAEYASTCLSLYTLLSVGLFAVIAATAL